jgi:hypothetical protein
MYSGCVPKLCTYYSTILQELVPEICTNKSSRRKKEAAHKALKTQIKGRPIFGTSKTIELVC